VTGSHSPEPNSQAEVIEFLADPRTHGGVGPVKRFETHGNLVFLAGGDAWKIKRAVHFAYMDFSSLASRAAACAREVERNFRLAPDIYLGCVPITRLSDGALALGGSGEVVEWTVHMRRFEQSALLSNIAATRGIDAELAKKVADVVYESHRQAPRAAPISGAAAMRELITSVCRALGGGRAFVAQEVSEICARFNEQICRTAAMLDARAREGAVRICHGDLHLANIVLWRNHPVLYDAIEFDDAIATIDVLYDLAFLLMDLEWHGQQTAANVVFNRYLWRSQDAGDLAALRAMPLFLGLRAAIRAMVTDDRAAQEPLPAADDDRARACVYLSAARRYLAASANRLIAIGGVSGTGKSTLAANLAARIAPPPGAVHLRSDLERKALFAAAETERLAPDTYTPAAADRVYVVLRSKARLVLGAGHSVIIDAVCATPAHRHALEAVAGAAGVAFSGLWLTADRATLAERLSARHGDASDATVSTLDRQLASDIGELSPGWTRLEANGSAAETLQRGLAALHADGAPTPGPSTGPSAGPSAGR
jgi:aminoglycoside phosphotransferase family enzyme/predicted kinase